MLTIIIPLYNVENYIRRCISSLLSQIKEEVEVILVDDGSIDRTREICEEFVCDFPFIKLYIQKNGGVSSARNLGIQHATGDWITFVDGDDWVEDDFIADLLTAIRTKPHAELFHWGYRWVNGEFDGNACIPTKEPKDIAVRIASSSYFGVSVCYAFKKDWIERFKVAFPENITHSEDQDFILKYIAHNPKIEILAKPYYNYIQLQTSASHQRLNINRVNCNLYVAADLAEYFAKNSDVSPQYAFNAIKRMMNSYFTLLYKADRMDRVASHKLYREKYYQIVSNVPIFKKSIRYRRYYYSCRYYEWLSPRRNKFLGMLDKVYCFLNYRIFKKSLPQWESYNL